MRILLSKFIDIRNKGYIKSIRKGSTGVGATFEYCIGKKEDSLEEPDFYGVEIKVRRAYSKSKISLFNYAPLGNGTYESKRLLEKYNLEAKETIFIDDSLPNIESANELGINAIQFTTLDEVKQKVNLLINRT